MKAIVVSAFGGPEVLQLRDVPAPVAGPGQVEIAVVYAGVNFVETIVRRGTAGFPVTPPYTPGNEVGGEIVAIGEGVDAVWIGRTVVARLNGSGGYAERVVTDLGNVSPVPEGATLIEAVALVAQGRTAVGIREDAGITPGDSVLITSAGGGVGLLLIQLARSAGAALIVAAARGEAKLAAARQIGADLAIDYSAPDWIATAKNATGGRGFDVTTDGIGGTIGRAAFDLLAPGTGRLVVFGFSSGEPYAISPSEVFGRSVRVIGYGAGRGDFAVTIPRDIAIALTELGAGRLKPVIGQTFPLADASAAHRLIESRGSLGKTILTIA